MKSRMICACIGLNAFLLCLSGCAGETTADTVHDAVSRPPRVASDAGHAQRRYTAAPPAPTMQPVPSIPPALAPRTVPRPTAPPAAVFSTSYKGGSTNRIHNIKRAAAAIDGIMLLPGGTFSYNDAVGPANKATGYKKARIFVRGKDAEGYGGGICQVSSTLFNAVELAGLDVTERHPHSKKVNYVPEGKDAATSFGSIDLCFVNNLPYAVQIAAAADEETITVRVVPAQLSFY